MSDNNILNSNIEKEKKAQKERILSIFESNEYDNLDLKDFILYQGIEKYKYPNKIEVHKEFIKNGILESYLKDTNNEMKQAKYGLVTEEELITEFTLEEVYSLLKDYVVYKDIIDNIDEFMYPVIKEKYAKKKNLDKARVKNFLQAFTVVPLTEITVEEEKEVIKKFLEDTKPTTEQLVNTGIYNELQKLGYDISCWGMYQEYLPQYLANTVYPTTVGEFKKAIQKHLNSFVTQEVTKIKLNK